MQLLDNLIQKTKCYKNLYRELSLCKREHEKLEFMYDEQYKHLVEKINELQQNKTAARRIVRLTNSLLKKDELVPTKKQIQTICHEIINGNGKEQRQ